MITSDLTNSILLNFVLISVSINCVTTLNLIEYPQNQTKCSIGDIVENRCTKCICNNNVYECSHKNCSQGFIVQETPEPNRTHCHPNTVYNLNGKTCICNDHGQWPHDSCLEIFKSLSVNITKIKCVPHKYIIISCNVCRCSTKGVIDATRCTKNNCETGNKTPSRRNTSSLSNKPTEFYGSCKAGTWYTMQSCQFCYCVEKNKFKCNNPRPIKNYLRVGKYNLAKCEKDIIKEAMALLPDSEKYIKSKATAETSNNKYEKTDKCEETDKQNDAEQQISSDNDGGDALVKLKINFRKDLSSKKHKLGQRQKMPTANEPSLLSILTPMENIGKKIRIDLPVAPKLAGIRSRRFILINPKFECIPGTKTVMDCNICHCMNNGKMICTDRVCN